jgi:hypothetical protein
MCEVHYQRRHLATGIDLVCGGPRNLKYEIERAQMASDTYDGLELIYKRDGAEIFEEVAGALLWEVLWQAEIRGCLPRAWRRMKNELRDEQKKEDARDKAGVIRLGASVLV